MADPSHKWQLSDITAEEADPNSLRAKVLRRAIDVTDADFAVWLTVHEVEDRLYYSPFLCEGDTQASQMWQNLPGKPAPDPLQTGVRNPTREERESFLPVGRRARLAGYDDPMQYSACRHFYEPHGVGDEARMLAFRGRQFIGWIGVFRWEDRPAFEAGDISRLNNSTDWVKAGLTAAHHLQSRQDGPDELYLVMTSGGKIVHASEYAAIWLTERRREDLGEVIKRFDRSDSGPLVVFDGMELRLSRMDGPGGNLHYMVHLTPAPVPSLTDPSRLPATERIAAENTLAGASVKELEGSIAATLDRLPTAAIIVTESLDIVCMNRQADQLLDSSDALQPRRGELIARRSAETSALRAAVADTLRLADSVIETPGPQIVGITRGAQLPLEVLVVPLRPRQNTGRHARVLLLIYDPEFRPSINAELIERLFDLTSTEAFVAARLAEGCSIREIARMRRCSRSTVRTHVKHIFQKTHTNRQGELVQLILTSPAISFGE